MEGFETGSFGLKVVDPRDLQVEPREFHAISFKTPVSQKQRVSSAWRSPDHMADVILSDVQARPVLGVKVTTETFVDVDGHESRENAAVED